MRFIYAFAIFMMAGFTAIGQKPTIHAIYFIDTKVEDIGAYCRMDLVYVEAQLRTMANALDYNYKAIVDTAENFNVANFESLPNVIKTGDSDVIVLYISSHGAAQAGGSDQFPSIAFGNGKYSPVSILHNKLKLLKHKSLLTIVDACNNYRDIIYNIAHSNKGMGKKIQDWAPLSCVPYNYRQLFGKPFDCIISASKPGEYSLVGRLGSLFTDIFFKQLKQMTHVSADDEDISLSLLIENVKSSTFIYSNIDCQYYLNKADPQQKPSCSPFTPVEDLQFR
jgi:hypothetical protein